MWVELKIDFSKEYLKKNIELNKSLAAGRLAEGRGLFVFDPLHDLFYGGLFAVHQDTGAENFGS